MKYTWTVFKYPLLGLIVIGSAINHRLCLAADHNDPNAINSIFSDIPVSAADLYDLFGFPGDDKTGGEKVVVALTFASVQKTGVFDTDVLYRLYFDPDPRVDSGLDGDQSLATILKYADAIKDKYFRQKASEVRVSFNKENRARIEFIDFPDGDFSEIIDTGKVETIESPDGQSIKAYIGGRDDAFFNDLPGFFRSINYAPQFYYIPRAMKDKREMPIPKTLIELEGNKLFNFDKDKPLLGQGVKEDFPEDSPAWNGKKFLKDENGNFRFVYSGKDAQAGKNVNAIILEIPLKFISKIPETERIVRTWGESWVLKASGKIAAMPDDKWYSIFNHFFGRLRTSVFPSSESGFNSDIANYKHVDTDGVPFLDAALNEREDERQFANNIKLARHYVIRFAHLGWGFGPSISALGIGTCFDHDNSPVSVYKTYNLATEAFPRVKKCFFQRVNMPDNSWN
ncbi:MAG: hypothetical protein WCH04_14240, partial [Gammaproteobacteria bacterium]